MSRPRPKKLWRSIILTTGATLGVFCLVWTVGLALLGLKPIVFVSGSMSPAIHTGAVAFTRSIPASQVAPGDVVSVLTAEGVRVTHRVVESTIDGATATLRIKGDANNTMDAEAYTLTSVDVVVGQIPLLGYFLQLAATPLGIGLGLSLLAACLWLGFARPASSENSPRSGKEGPKPSPKLRRRRAVVGAVGLVAGAVWLGSVVAPAHQTLAYWHDSPTVMSPAGGITTAEWFTCAQTTSAATGIQPWSRWKFNEAPGTQTSEATPFFADSVGTGHNSAYFVGTNPNLVTPSVGHADHACARDSSTSVYLNGGTGASAQYIRMQYPIQNANGPAGSRWNNFTINVWFKTDVSGGDDLAGALAAYSQAAAIGESPEPPTDRVLYIDKNGLVRFEVYPQAYRVRTSTTSAADNKWHMATATLGPQGQCLYLDGVLQGGCDASTTSAWQGNSTTSASSTYWRFGNAIMSAGFPGIDDLNLAQRAFKGYLDDAAIWRSQLTGEQVREMYRAALPLP